MKVDNIIIYSDFGFIAGGAGKVAIDSAVGLAKKGYKVIFFCGTGPISPLLLNKGIEVICMHQPDMLSDKNKLQAAFRSIWNEKAYSCTLDLLEKYSSNNTVVMVHGFSKTLSTSIFAAFKKTSFNVIFILHDYFATCPNGGFYNYQKQCVCNYKPMSKKCILCNCDARSYMQKLYRCVRQLFVNHNIKGNKKYLYAYNVSKLSGNLMAPYIKNWFKEYGTLYNPVDVNTSSYVDITQNRKYLFIGRLSEEKGIRDFCRVLTELHLDGIVIGDGYLLSELKLKYPQILFVGWKNGPEKLRYINQAKCLIFPSKCHETFGLVVPEILGYGVPCIVPDGCGASELIHNSINGFIFKMNNYEDLRKKILMFEDTNMCKIGESTTVSFHKEDYTLDAYIDKLEALFERFSVRWV
jgi:glycosyltransferase involved in cell wall biosynthesis